VGISGIIPSMFNLFFASISLLFNVPQEPRVERPIAIFFSGTPGMGKTTLAMELEKEFDAIRINHDDARRSLDPEDDFHDYLRLALSQCHGHNLIFDGSIDRTYPWILPLAKKEGFRPVVIRLEVDKEIVRERIISRGTEVDRFLGKLEKWWSDYNSVDSKAITLHFKNNKPLTKELVMSVKEAIVPTLNYITVGTGPKRVLLMHDWMGDHTSFGELLAYLDAESCTFLLPDFRGYGGSKELEGNYTLDETTNDTLFLLDSLGWDNCHLIGYSMSGMIATKLIEMDPRFKSFVAISPIGPEGSPIPDDFKLAFETKGGRLKMLTLSYGNFLSDLWLKRKVDRWENSSSQNAVMGYLDMFSKTKFEPKKSSIPTLILAGEHDGPGFQVNDLAKTMLPYFTEGKIRILPGVTHFPMQESPQQTASFINTFINTN